MKCWITKKNVFPYITHRKNKVLQTLTIFIQLEKEQKNENNSEQHVY